MSNMLKVSSAPSPTETCIFLFSWSVWWHKCVLRGRCFGWSVGQSASHPAYLLKKNFRVLSTGVEPIPFWNMAIDHWQILYRKLTGVRLYLLNCDSPGQNFWGLCFSHLKQEKNIVYNISLPLQCCVTWRKQGSY